MKSLLSRLDWPILFCVLILFGFGASTIASVAPEFLVNQLVFYFIGIFLFFFFAFVDYQAYFSLGKIFYIVTLFFLGLTLFLGFESHGAIRWLAIGGFRFQFSELIKPFFVITTSVFILSLPRRSFLSFLRLAAIILLPIFLVFKQPDLGSSIVYLVSTALLIFVSEISLFYVLISSLIFILTLPFIWFFLADYQKSRLLTFISPHSDPLGSSYNAIQSVITVGSGMIFGRGLGRGPQSHLFFLPEHHTDFIFASISEEFGFLGAFSLIGVYFFLIWRIFSLAVSSHSAFARLIATGIGGMLLTQVVINIGMNVGLLPVTGITLPLVSYGGSSLLATMLGLGIIENIAISSKQEDTIHIV